MKKSIGNIQGSHFFCKDCPWIKGYMESEDKIKRLEKQVKEYHDTLMNISYLRKQKGEQND